MKNIEEQRGLFRLQGMKCRVSGSIFCGYALAIVIVWYQAGEKYTIKYRLRKGKKCVKHRRTGAE